MSLNSSPDFIHLRLHSEFSVVDGIVRLDNAVQFAAADRQGALALTDLNNLFGLIKFYRAGRALGIKPIAGCDLWLHNHVEPDKPLRLLLLVCNWQGYLNLCELITRAYLSNMRLGQPQVQREWFKEQQGRLSQGLIALSGGRYGEVGAHLEHGNLELAEQLALEWATIFPQRFFIELQRANREGDEAYVQLALSLAAKLQLPVVATHPIQFLKPDDFRAHEARVCIAEGEILANPRRTRHFTEQQYFKSRAEMQALFADIPLALAHTVEIAKCCNLSLELGQAKLPVFPTPAGISLDEYMLQLAREGLEKRFLTLFPDPQERAAKWPEYSARLELECRTIINMGFAGYFLIVQDFINWAKNNGVPVGPGRGSGAGSLVAFCLGITDLDPLRYDLLFERFLNPDRVSMPDFDIDFCQDNRDRVIEYVKQRYGREAVSQIATFGSLGAKAVIRDVGRVLDLPYGLCDSLAKLIPHVPTDPWDLQRALDKEPAFKERYEKEEEARALIDLARPLEGLIRNVGMHAGGVLIAPGKLTDFCPLYCQPGHTDIAISQYDKDDVEAIGLVKFDFLGLRNLTILDWAVRFVRQFNTGKQDFDLMTLALDDANTYKLLSEANTTAIFQLESRGMKELLKKLKPNTFEDVIAVLALFRPGPLGSGMVDDFVNRKHGRAKAEYFHPDLEPVLKSTYGVIVYQEQVMLISQIIGGYTLGSADLLRRAMGKKKAEEMAQQRTIFEEGARKKGYEAGLAVTLFNLMEKFAEYGFNKSHTAAYALIAYQTAWLKTHHPAEFMAATLSSDMDDTDKVQIFYADTLANKVTVLPPDINYSCFRFEPVQDEYVLKGLPPRTIRYGLGAIKGTGESAVSEIARARATGGPFKDLFDFCYRIDRHIVNRRAMDALIKAGAFDALEANRAALLASLDIALESAEQRARAANQVSLFEMHESPLAQVQLLSQKPWSEREKLAQEKVALGFYFSGHLFTSYRAEVRRIVKQSLNKIQPARNAQIMAGIIVSLRTQMTRRGKMIFALLNDGTGQVEVSIFNELYEQHRRKLREDELLIVSGKVSHDEYSGGMRIVADSLLDLVGARAIYLKSLRLYISLNLPVDAHVSNSSYELIDKLKTILEPYRSEPSSSVPVEIVYSRAGTRCIIKLGDSWRVMVPDTLIEQLNECFSPHAIECFYG